MGQSDNQLSQDELLQSAMRGAQTARPKMMPKESLPQEDEDEEKKLKKPSDPDSDPDDETDNETDEDDEEDEESDDDDDDDDGTTGTGTSDTIDDNQLVQVVKKKRTTLKFPIDLTHRQAPKIKPKEAKDPTKIEKSPWQQFCDFLIHGVKGAQIKNGDLSTKINLLDEILVGLGFKEYQKDVLLQKQAKAFWLNRLLGKTDTSLLNTDTKTMIKRLSKEDKTIADIFKLNQDTKKPFLKETQKEEILKKGRELLKNETITSSLSKKTQESIETQRRFQEVLKEKTNNEIQRIASTQQNQKVSESIVMPTIALNEVKQQDIQLNKIHQQETQINKVHQQETQKTLQREEAQQQTIIKTTKNTLKSDEEVLKAQTILQQQALQAQAQDQMIQNAQMMMQAQNAMLAGKAMEQANELSRQMMNHHHHHHPHHPEHPHPHMPHPHAGEHLHSMPHTPTTAEVKVVHEQKQNNVLNTAGTVITNQTPDQSTNQQIADQQHALKESQQSVLKMSAQPSLPDDEQIPLSTNGNARK